MSQHLAKPEGNFAIKGQEILLQLLQESFTEYIPYIYIPGIDKRRTTENFRNILIRDIPRNNFSQARQNSNISASILYSVLQENHQRFTEINWEEQGEKICAGR